MFLVNYFYYPAALFNDGRVFLTQLDGSKREATADEIAVAKRLMWRDEVYVKAAQLLNSQSAGYASVEIATWPQMQNEIIEYNNSGAIGLLMLNVINRGRHTAETLSALLTPKIKYQNDVLQARDNYLVAINELSKDVQEYDTTTGWPIQQIE